MDKLTSIHLAPVQSSQFFRRVGVEGLLGVTLQAYADGVGKAALAVRDLLHHAGRFVEIEPEVYYIDRLPVNVEPLEFATVAAVGLLTAAGATLLPLAATVVLRPVDGLRQ